MPSKLLSIAVYCASSSQVDDIYKENAAAVGTFLATQNFNVVYGGGHVGLMGIMADAALAGGARVTGVITRQLMEREVAHRGLTKLHITETMQERQKMMAELADAFIILPGGLGTLAEFFEVLTWKQLGLHDKPIAVFNVNGYWNALQNAILQAKEQGFLRQTPEILYTMVENFENLGKLLIQNHK